MVYIDAVHYETDSHGCEIISKLKWTNDLNQLATNICDKKDMIKFINDNPNSTKTKYVGTYSSQWVEGEYVRVVNNLFLRTDSNGVSKDNLGFLARF